MSKRKSLKMPLILILIGSCSLLILIIFINKTFKSSLNVNSEFAEFMENQENIRKQGYVSFEPDFLKDSIIVSNDPEQMLEDLERESISGINLKEYKNISTYNDGDEIINKYVQYHNGIMVSDAIICVYAKLSGELIRIDGKYIDEDQFVNDNKVSLDDALEILATHKTSKPILSRDESTLIVSIISSHILPIFLTKTGT